MSNTKFVKIITGETIMGTYNEQNNTIEDVALIQVVPGASGIQVAIVPYGFPFEEKIQGSMGADKIVYEYASVPSDLESKYLQAKSNITISSSIPQDNLLGGASGSQEKVLDLENIFKKG